MIKFVAAECELSMRQLNYHEPLALDRAEDMSHIVCPLPPMTQQRVPSRPQWERSAFYQEVPWQNHEMEQVAFQRNLQ